MNEEHFNLIQAEIDGLNTEAESKRVQVLIANDPELHAAFDELLFAKTALESLRDVEPPATLKASIMRAIPDRSTAPVESADPWWSTIADLVRLPKPVSLAYAFSLGLVVAFIVSSVILPPMSGSTSDQISGSMISSDLSGYEILAEYDLGEETGGSLRVTRDQNQIIVKFVWDREESVRARVYFDEEWVDVIGTRSIERPKDLKTTTTERDVEVEGSGPITEYISLRTREFQEGDETDIHFDIRSGDRFLLRRSLIVHGRE